MTSSYLYYPGCSMDSTAKAYASSLEAVCGPLGVDLHEVDLAVEIEGTVEIVLVGTPAGVTDGGVVDFENRQVNVRALPSSMPDLLELDVSGLMIGHHLSVDALVAPAGTEILDDPATVIVTLVPPRVEQAEPEEVVAEPEVVGGAKSEE